MIFHNDIYMYRTSLQLDKSPYNSVHTVKYLSGVFEAAQNKTLVVCHSSKSDAMSSLIRRIQNKCDNVWSLGFTPTKQAIWRFHLGNGNISQFPHTQRFTEKIYSKDFGYWKYSHSQTPLFQHTLTLRGFSLRYGGSPSTISMAMIPRDQMSTLGP